MIAAGSTLAADYLVERMPVLEPLKRFVASSRTKGVLGSIALIIGFVKLFWRAPGELIIVGDFFPAIAGMLLGAMLLIERYRERQLSGEGVEQVTADNEVSEEDPALDSAVSGVASDSAVTGIAEISNALRPYRTPLGLGGIVVGVVHFFLANVMFL